MGRKESAFKVSRVTGVSGMGDVPESRDTFPGGWSGLLRATCIKQSAFQMTSTPEQTVEGASTLECMEEKKKEREREWNEKPQTRPLTLMRGPTSLGLRKFSLDTTLKQMKSTLQGPSRPWAPSQTPHPMSYSLLKRAAGTALTKPDALPGTPMNNCSFLL